MKSSTLTILFIVFSSQILPGQLFYLQTFPSAAFPTGWSTNSSRVTPNDAEPSSGYGPPNASGGYNMRLWDCEPTGDTIQLTVSGVISTVDRTDIRVGFGIWRGGGFSRPISIRWSANGTTWHTISNNITDSVSTGWKLIYFDLPPAAQNVPNLRVRFSYVTQTNTSCTASPPAFRLDDFAVGENFSLPIELLRFDAQVVGSAVRLFWTTASEQNSAYFDIERGGEDARFEPIGRIGASGHSLEVRRYEFLDERPLPGINYYRLRMTDADGTYAYSPALQVYAPTREGELQVFPSPARAFLNVAYPASGGGAPSDAHWKILDLLGRVWLQGNATDNDARSIPVDALPAGNYVFQCTVNNRLMTKRFQKL
ncbi:MAG: T9SS type A sorting domain-containing protein [Saprospiraceae bacterium]|nr:T9SS type A sorting domain-containing protein [Saprospiraceae bacterium]MDW8484030.1 T9SS type A sorting domain-containing protein [Saprospiraceae bacterium]